MQSTQIDTTRESYESEAGVQAFFTEGFRGVEEQVVDTYFQPLGNVLDLGCGTGRTSILLAERGHTVEAIDYAEAMITVAKKRYQHTNLLFKVMDAAQLSYPDASFHYALFSYNGLDYLYPEEKRTRALKEIYRVLKPGGVFAFSSHNLLCVPTRSGRAIRLARTILAGKIYPYQWDFQSFGRLLTYYISPRRQIRQLESVGFTLLELASAQGISRLQITLRDAYPTYVCKK